LYLLSEDPANFSRTSHIRKFYVGDFIKSDMEDPKLASSFYEKSMDLITRLRKKQHDDTKKNYYQKNNNAKQNNAEIVPNQVNFHSCSF
jgi:hypothetical protein